MVKMVNITPAKQQHAVTVNGASQTLVIYAAHN